MIQSHIKAWIAKSVWQDEGFFPIWHETDEVFQESLKLFEEAAKIEKLKF